MRWLKKSPSITRHFNNKKETSKENLKNPKVSRLDQSQPRVSRVKERQRPGVLTSASTGAHYPSLFVLRFSDARPRSLALSRKLQRHARPPRL